MKIFYTVMIIIFLVLVVIYAFMSIRLSMISKKKRQFIRKSWPQDKLEIVREYEDCSRVTLKEIFGLKNGKSSKK